MRKYWYATPEAGLRYVLLEKSGHVITVLDHI